MNLKSSAIAAALITLPGAYAPAGVVAHYPMEINSSGEISERITGRSFTVHGNFGAESAPGVKGNALFLDGYTSYVGAVMPRLNPMRRATISLWVAIDSYPIVKVDSENPGGQTCIVNCLDDAARTGFGYFLGFDGQYSFQIYIGGEKAIVNVPSGLPRYRWNCLSAVIDADAGQLTFYNNGNEVASADCSKGDINLGESTLHIAQDGWEVWFGSGVDAFRTTAFGGVIDELKVEDRTYSADELRTWRADATPVVSAPAGRYEGDRWRPQYHGLPSTAWTNEPHGLIWTDNRWHIFFQKNSLGPYMARLHWGHLASTDLFGWYEEQTAIAPGTPLDMKGCWSGCVFTDPEISGNRPNILYTGVDYGRARILRATSNDNSLVKWTKDNSPLIDQRPDGLGDDFRDPYFFRSGGKPYIIVGSSRDGRGLVTLHRYDNGTWSRHQNDDFYWGKHAEVDGSFIEMPSLTFMPDGTALFCYTPLGTENGTMALYRTGRVGTEGNDEGRFITDDASVEPRRLDMFGRDGYGMLSPSIAVKDGRVIALGIVPDKLGSADNKANGWAHCYSLPREWSLDQNRQLCQKPADEVQWIRSRQTFSQKNFTLSGDRYIGSGRHMEFKAVARCGSAPWGIRFLKNPANPDHSHASLTVNPADGSITLSLQHMPRIVNDGIYNGLYTASFPELIAPGKEVTVDLFIDGSVADIFLNERYAASVRIYPHDENGVQAELFSTGGDTGFIAADAWPINTLHNRSATAHTMPLTEQSRRMAILVENADPEALSPSERAALRLFEAACPNGAVLTPGDIGNLSFNNYGTLWIHIDRCGLDRNNPPLSSPEITSALSSFLAQGGSLYLSGHATLLLAKTGRIDGALAPNIFGNGDGGTGTDVWNIQPRIGYNNRESDPSQYYDRSGHTIFADMYTIDTPQGRTIPMEGTGDGSEMWREDHNCMWDLNGLSYTADGRNTVERFERQTNSTVLGQWGHVTDYAVAGLVEFHPQASASRAMPAQGTVIANGLAAYELLPRIGGNSYTANVERLTGNILRYLESKDPRGSMTSVETPETDTTPPTPVFTSSPGAITYRGVTPGETIYVYTPDGRLAANSTAIYPDGSISLPLHGTAFVGCGSHAAKILMK